MNSELNDFIDSVAFKQLVRDLCACLNAAVRIVRTSDPTESESNAVKLWEETIKSAMSEIA